MDWQTLLVHDGQTIVVATGVAIGFTALVFYRVKSRWGMFDADKAREREERKRRLSKIDNWGN